MIGIKVSSLGDVPSFALFEDKCLICVTGISDVVHLRVLHFDYRLLHVRSD